MNDPFEGRNAQIFTWMLCAKRLGIPKGVDVLIAKRAFTVLDLTQPIKWDEDLDLQFCIWWRGPYEWIWVCKQDINGRPPCNVCLRPCYVIEQRDQYNYLCVIHGLLKPRWNCAFCGVFGICTECFVKTYKNVKFQERYLSDRDTFHAKKVLQMTSCMNGKIRYK